MAGLDVIASVRIRDEERVTTVYASNQHPLSQTSKVFARNASKVFPLISKCDRDPGCALAGHEQIAVSVAIVLTDPTASGGQI